MRIRQGLAMVFHLLAAEQFRTQRWLVGGEIFSQSVSGKAGPPMAKGFEKAPAAQLQVWGLLF
jgi:hypothetical protein